MVSRSKENRALQDLYILWENPAFQCKYVSQKDNFLRRCSDVVRPRCSTNLKCFFFPHPIRTRSNHYNNQNVLESFNLFTQASRSDIVRPPHQPIRSGSQLLDGLVRTSSESHSNRVNLVYFIDVCSSDPMGPPI